jgi:hypothetical protein
MADGKVASITNQKSARADLIETWIADHGASPPKGLSTRLLSLSAAYEAQVRDHGGLRPATRKRLLAAAGAAKGGGGTKSMATAACDPAPGTRLVREWQGESHVVDVQDGHVIYDGRTFKSLSAVARAITGARWSGPRFFGLSGT